jgi:hypothetical protein
MLEGLRDTLADDEYVAALEIVCRWLERERMRPVSANASGPAPGGCQVSEPPVELLLSRLEGVRRSGSGWVARCPAHEDRTPSLSVARADDGRVLLHCHASCPTDRVLAEIGLAWADLYDQPSSARSRRTTPAVVTREEADYIGPGGEPHKLRPPLTKADFDSDHEFDLYVTWRVGDGRLPPRRTA